MSESALVSLHILVVNADPSLGLIFRDALADMGYAGTLATTQKQAQRELNHHPFDLIVVDSSANTRQDAIESLRPLLALSHPLPIVLCSLVALSETDLKREGFAGQMRLPVTLDQLVTTVAECLNQPWTPSQLPQAEVVQRLVAAFIQQDADAFGAFAQRRSSGTPGSYTPIRSLAPPRGGQPSRCILTRHGSTLAPGRLMESISIRAPMA
jgi:CheY-like chemotaxis protein